MRRGRIRPCRCLWRYGSGCRGVLFPGRHLSVTKASIVVPRAPAMRDRAAAEPGLRLRSISDRHPVAIPVRAARSRTDAEMGSKRDDRVLALHDGQRHLRAGCGSHHLRRARLPDPQAFPSRRARLRIALRPWRSWLSRLDAVDSVRKEAVVLEQAHDNMVFARSGRVRRWRLVKKVNPVHIRLKFDVPPEHLVDAAMAPSTVSP